MRKLLLASVFMLPAAAWAQEDTTRYNISVTHGIVTESTTVVDMDGNYTYFISPYGGVIPSCHPEAMLAGMDIDLDVVPMAVPVPSTPIVVAQNMNDNGIPVEMAQQQPAHPHPAQPQHTPAPAQVPHTASVGPQHAPAGQPHSQQAPEHRPLPYREDEPHNRDSHGYRDHPHERYQHGGHFYEYGMGPCWQRLPNGAFVWICPD